MCLADSNNLLTAAIADGRFPSPPASDLYFVTKGRPTDALIISFLEYVLAEGQKSNEDCGYVAIPEEKQVSVETDRVNDTLIQFQPYS